MAKKEKPVAKKRLLKGARVGSLQGPYYTEGNLGDKLPRVHEAVFFDEDTGNFVFGRDGRSYVFDGQPTKHTTPPKTARQQEREALMISRVKERKALNDLLDKEPLAVTRAEKKEIKQAIEDQQSKVDKVEAALALVKTSTDKVDEMSGLVVEKRKLPTMRKRKLPVLAEYDRKTHGVKLFFDGARVNEKGAPINCKNEYQCNVLAPAVRAVLSEYSDPAGHKHRGQYGYWAVSAWEWPEVKRKLLRVEGVDLKGYPEGELKNQFKQLDAKAKSIDSKKILFGPFPPRVGHYADGSKAPFQEEGVKFLMSRNYAILADDMGLGKTYQAIIAAHNAVPKNQQILIMCPAAVVGSWANDIKAFMPSAAVTTIDSKFFAKGDKPSDRPEKLRFVICSYQGASSQQGKASVSNYLLHHKWGLVIFDEAHRLKKPDTLGHKFAELLKTDRMWFLTGTPIANKPIDAFGLLKLDRHPDGWRKDKFVEKYVSEVAKSGKAEVAVDTRGQVALGRAMSGYVLRRTKEEVLKSDLPRKFGGIATGEGFLHAELPEGFGERLEEMSEGGAIGADGTVEGKAGFERLRHALAVAKVPATWEVAQRVIDAGDKVVLFSTYTDVLMAFAEICEDQGLLYIVISGAISTVGKSAMVKLFQEEPLSSTKGNDELGWAEKNLGRWWLDLVQRVPEDEIKPKERAEIVKRFGSNPDKWPHTIQVVLAQMVAASEGVTLTRADTLLFNDMDWMPSRHEQAEDRIYRLSKGGKLFHPTVYIGYLISNDPLGIDDTVLTGLQAKRADIQRVYRAIDKDARGKYGKMIKEQLKALSDASALRKNPRSTLGR